MLDLGAEISKWGGCGRGCEWKCGAYMCGLVWGCAMEGTDDVGR
jgi:hypothetical protein